MSSGKHAPSMRYGVVVAILTGFGLVWPPTAAAADERAVPAAGHVVVEHRLGPREAREDCFDLAAAGRVDYAFEFVGEIRFNLHHHVGEETLYDVGPLQLSATEDVASLPDAGRYCLMYTHLGNGDAYVRGHYRVLAP